MRLFTLFVMSMSVFGFDVTDAQEVTSAPSAFDMILQRIRERDAETGAILSVSAFSDAPDPDATYSMTIRPIPRSSDVLVELRGIEKPRLVYESYRLLGTPEIESERQKLGSVNRSSMRPVKKPDYVFLNITHLRQGKNLCAPTSASMALLHFGERVAPERIKSLANSVTTKPDFAGTYFEDIVNGLKKIGATWDLRYFKTNQEGFEAGLKEITSSLDEGCPVIVDMNVPPDGHTVLVNGYDPNRQLISIVDPLIPAPGLRQLTYREFEVAWRSLTADIRGGIFTSQPRE